MSKFKSNEEYFQYAKTLSIIPAEDLAGLLQSAKLRVPFYIHRFVLCETIYSKVFAAQLYNTYTDELKYRLRGYKDYSIFLLEKLIIDFNLDFDAAKYKEIFFDLLFLNRTLYGIKDSFFNDLDKMKYKYAVDFEKIKYDQFMTQFGKIFYEPTGYLDGVNLGILKDVLVHSCTLGDLRGLGEKYNVKLPRRINKFQLVDILAARFRLSDQEKTLLMDKSVLELEIYAKEKGFKISIDLKKSDMVEYLVFSLGMYHLSVVKDNHSYEVPRSEDLESVKIEEISFQQNDQDIPIVEEDVAVVKTERIEETEEKVETAPVKVEVLPQQKPEIKPELKPEPKVEQKPVVEPIVNPEVVQEIKPEPKVEQKPEPQPETPVAPQPIEQPAKPKLIEPIKTEMPAVPVDFSEEEKALLDEKIAQIIKKYHKRHSRRVFFTVLGLIVGAAIVGLGVYGYLYFTIINPGNLPFNIPIFW